MAMLLAGLCACDPATGPEAPASADSPTTGETGEPPAPERPASDATSDRGDEAETEDGGDSVGFLQPVDFGGVHSTCSLFMQDCPDGEKCTVFSQFGGGFDTTKCVPVHPQPDAAGESCWADEDDTGLDSCEFGTFCWDVDPETNVGMCVAFCGGSEANPTCERANEECSGGKEFLVCLPVCDPLDQDCPVGCACYESGRSFQCIPDASGEAGHVGDPCEFVNACKRGNMCASAAGVPGCSGSSGCCSSYCTLGDDSVCMPDQSCVPAFESGTAPEGLEDVGVCFIPQ